MHVCMFFFVCIQKVRKSLDIQGCRPCTTQKVHLFNLQILFLPLLPLVLRELPVLLHEEDVSVTLPNHSLVFILSPSFLSIPATALNIFSLRYYTSV